MPIAILGVLSDLFLSEKNTVSEDIWMNRNAVRMILLISAIYSTAYALTLAKGIFYDEMMFGFQLNNLRFGQLFSALGICSMLAYLCAAWFSTRFSSRAITLTALLVNAAIPLFLIIAFFSFVTAADSNTNAMAGLCSEGMTTEDTEAPVVLKILWGGIAGVLCLVAVCGNGTDGIKALCNVGGFPAAIMFVFFLVGWIKIMRNPAKYDVYQEDYDAQGRPIKSKRLRPVGEEEHNGLLERLKSRRNRPDGVPAPSMSSIGHRIPKHHNKPVNEMPE